MFALSLRPHPGDVRSAPATAPVAFAAGRDGLGRPLREVTAKAPLQSPLFAFLLDIWVARRQESREPARFMARKLKTSQTLLGFISRSRRPR